MLENFSKDDLIGVFVSIGVDTIAKRCFRIFPINHSSTIILEALTKELERLK